MKKTIKLKVDKVVGITAGCHGMEIEGKVELFHVRQIFDEIMEHFGNDLLERQRQIIRMNEARVKYERESGQETT